MIEFKPYTSHKDALGTLLDLIQLARIDGRIVLDKEETKYFFEALMFYDRNE